MGCNFRLLAATVALAWPCAVFGGGPRLVAGATYFNPGVMGQPVRWAGGVVNYYVDQGPLSAAVDHQQAIAMVDDAAALWNHVPTAGVLLVGKGELAEDVSGANVVAGNGGLLQPADVAASSTGYPLGIIFDSDGSVIDAVVGAHASDPTGCNTTGVVLWTDNIQPDATVAHAVVVRAVHRHRGPAGDDELSGGAGIRAGARPRALAGISARAYGNARRRSTSVADHAAGGRSLRTERRQVHPQCEHAVERHP